MEIFVYFAQCSALIVSFIILLRWFYPTFLKKSGIVQSVIFGIAFAVIGFITMRLPLNVTNGLHMDARLVSVFFSGVFGGPVAALITTAVLVLYRLSLGGTMLFGIAGIAGAAVISIWAHRLRQNNERSFEK
jgi:LytS/YehU family sensor histidine kinase